MREILGMRRGANGARTRGRWPPFGNYDFLTFGGTMESFAALATRNFTTFLAGILMAWPVAGLRPIRALRSTRTNRPNPGTTKTPFFFTSAMAVVDSAFNR